MKALLLALPILITTSSAWSYNIICDRGQIKTTVRINKDRGCRSQYNVLYSGGGRCLTEDSLSRVQGLKLNNPYIACVREYPGQVAGSYVASIEMVGQDLNERTILE